MSGIKAVGLISAAGLSSRMGAFKPLLDLGGKPLICRTVESLLDGGAENVIVVTGRNSEQVCQALAVYPQVQTVYNAHYAETSMYDSIRLGLQQITDCDVLLFLPADVPAIRPETVRVLLEAWAQSRPDVLYPIYAGMQWHPPVMAGHLLPLLLQYDGVGGLKGALEQYGTHAAQLLMPDKGCMMDADYAEEYEQLCAYWPLRQIPDEDVCSVLYQIADTPEPVRLHCKAVAEKAMELAELLEATGVLLNRALLYSAALLHDVCRSAPNHAEAGAAFLRRYGFYQIAELVAVHMDWPETRPIMLDEAALLYLADKLVSGNQAVSLEQRFAEKQARYADQPEIAAQIARRQAVALEIQRQLEW